MQSKIVFFILSLFLCLGCQKNESIISQLDEREANQIIVFLASHNIEAQKVAAAKTEAAGGASIQYYNIMVDQDKTVEAMSLLNQNGLPRKKGTTLLDLFAKSGLMSTDKEETIRYQSGLEQELTNIIQKIDGVIDANVQISFPAADTFAAPGTPPPRVKAAVYVKHQGVLEDANLNIESKIKRLVSGAVDNLSFDDVLVISDRSRFLDSQLPKNKEMIGSKPKINDYVSVWSIIMTKSSSVKFRAILFSLIGIIVIILGVVIYFIFRYYPMLRKEKEKPKNESEEQ